MSSFRTAFLISIFLFEIFPGFYTLFEWEAFKSCPEYSHLTQGDWNQFFGKKWYLYETSDNMDHLLDTCVQLEYSGGSTLEEKEIFNSLGSIRSEHTRYVKKLYLLNTTDTFAATLECTDYGLWYSNKLHILTSTRRPDNTTELQAEIDSVLHSNGLLLTMNSAKQNCD